MSQIQIQENKVLDKARVIAASKRVRRFTTEESRNIWLVGSGRFYKAIYDEHLDDFICDCKAFEFTLEPCKHVYACSIHEGV